MNSLFTADALKCEPRLSQVDFDFSEIMDYNNDFAFISGSVVEGFGNSASDVDIYIVSKRDVGFPDGKKTNYTNEEEGYYNEINWYSTNWHKSVAEKINILKLDELWHSIVTFDELNYYYRSSIGIPLINPAHHYTGVRHYSKQRILKVLEHYYGFEAYKAMQYAMQFKDISEFEQGYFWINRAMGKMVDSVLASSGEGYPSNKFRYLKIERAFGKESELYIKAKQFGYLGNYDKLDYINKVQEFVIALGINKYEFDDTVIRYKIAGSLERVDLFHSYAVHNAGNVFQMDDNCLTILDLIREGYDSRESIHKYCSAKKDSIVNALNEILSQLQLYGILEIK